VETRNILLSSLDILAVAVVFLST